MKAWPPLILTLLFATISVSAHEPAYPAQFRGVCQQCGRDLMAYYRPVQCLDGRVERNTISSTRTS
jgi:hypothetical protein